MAATQEIMTWLITGGSGQLARCLADLLEKENQAFRLMSKRDLDVSSNEAASKIIREAPSLIVNCAAYTFVDKAEIESDLANATNVKGARNVAAAAKDLKVPLIHISTDYVFSGESNTPWSANSPTKPVTEYGKSKLAGENEIFDLYAENSFILRTAWLYSSYGSNFAKSILRKMMTENKELKVVSDQFGQPTSAHELSEKILELAKTFPAPGTYHVTNSGQASWFEFAQEIVSLAGHDPIRISPISSIQYDSLAQRPKYSVLDNSAWINQGLPKMSPWKEALRSLMPKLKTRVEREISNG